MDHGKGVYHPTIGTHPYHIARDSILWTMVRVCTFLQGVPTHTIGPWYRCVPIYKRYPPYHMARYSILWTIVRVMDNCKSVYLPTGGTHPYHFAKDSILWNMVGVCTILLLVPTHTTGPWYGCVPFYWWYPPIPYDQR